MLTSLWSKPSARGSAMVLVATLAWSFAGVFTRLLSIEMLTAVALRSLSGGLFLFAWLLLRRGRGAFRDLFKIGRVGWIVVLLSVAAQAATTTGLFLTSVAHVAVIYATGPFIAAVIARVWLGERVRRGTMVAILASLGGVVCVVSGTSGVSSPLGDALAFVMTASFALIIVLTKAHPTMKVLEVSTLGALLTALLFAPFFSLQGLDARNLGTVTLYGFVSMVFAYLTFVRGARLISAVSSGLIVTLEIALSPYWVWLIFNERIDLPTLIGGVIVTAAVIGHLVLNASRRAA